MPEIELTSGTWTIDPSKTTVTATSKMLMVFDVPASLDVTFGTVTIDDGRIHDVDVTVESSEVSGTVEIKGQSVPLTFAISKLNIDTGAGSFTATGQIDRIEAGVDRSPTFVIGKTIDIDLDVHLSSSNV